MGPKAQNHTKEPWKDGIGTLKKDPARILREHGRVRMGETWAGKTGDRPARAAAGAGAGAVSARPACSPLAFLLLTLAELLLLNSFPF